MVDGIARLRKRLARGLEVAEAVWISTEPSTVSTSSAPASMAARAISSSSCPSRETERAPLDSNCQATEPFSPRLPPARVNSWRMAADGAVAVVSDGGDEDGGAAGAEAFVGDLDELIAIAAAGGLGNGAGNVVVGHVGGPRPLDDEAQLEVGIRVAAASLGRRAGSPWQSW